MGNSSHAARALALALLAWSLPARAQPPAPRHRADANVAEGSTTYVAVFADLPRSAPTLLPGGDPSILIEAQLAPRFWLGRAFQARALFGGGAVFGNSDTTTGSRGRVSDLFADLWFHGVPRAGDFYPALHAGLRFPTSEASRARTMFLGTELGAQLVWWRRSDALTWFARGSLAWAHEFNQYNGPVTRTSFVPACTSVTDDACVDRVPIATVGSVSWLLLFAPRWSWFSPGIQYGMSHAYVAGGDRAPSIGALTSTRFAVWAEVIPHPVLSIVLSYSARRALLDARGNLNNPFGSDTNPGVIGLAVALRLDVIADAARGQELGPGGLVWW